MKKLTQTASSLDISQTVRTESENAREDEANEIEGRESFEHLRYKPSDAGVSSFLPDYIDILVFLFSGFNSDFFKIITAVSVSMMRWCGYFKSTVFTLFFS